MNIFLLIGGICSLVAAILHIGCIVYGARWYKFFGAGKRMVKLSSKGSAIPTIITLPIAIVLAVFGIFAVYSAIYTSSALPMTLQVLIFITAIYLIRGFFGLLFILKPLGRTKNFWIWSSWVCIIVGAIHCLGILNSNFYG